MAEEIALIPEIAFFEPKSARLDSKRAERPATPVATSGERDRPGRCVVRLAPRSPADFRLLSVVWIKTGTCS